jgi:uncharacterized protein YggU (UPF0235/DUF167 family)
MADHRPWTAAEGGIALTVRLTPKGGRDAVEAIERLADGRAVLKARVRAAASEGAANAALIRLIAATLGVAPRDVRIAAGVASRVKRVAVEGDPKALAARLDAMFAAVPAD